MQVRRARALHADAAEEGGASRAEQGSDDDFQHLPPGATKGGRAKDAEAPSSNANGKRPMGIKGPVGAEELAGLNQGLCSTVRTLLEHLC